jgi:hypothetical protein
MFVRDDSLAGRVVVWPDGEPWRMVPVSSYQLPVDGWQ